TRRVQRETLVMSNDKPLRNPRSRIGAAANREPAVPPPLPRPVPRRADGPPFWPLHLLRPGLPNWDWAEPVRYQLPCLALGATAGDTTPRDTTPAAPPPLLPPQ